MSRVEVKNEFSSRVEKEPCICCFNSPGYRDHIFSGDLSRSAGRWEEWILCEKHLFQKRKFGLVKFASWHPAAIEDLREKGFEAIASQAYSESFLHCEAFI